MDESSLTTLKGNVPGLARAEYDQGEAQSSTQLTNVRLVLSRTDAQQAALDQYLSQLQNKSSSNYHKWLTPAQFGALYGPADSDVTALEAWLESHGLKVETVSVGRTNIAFSGTVSQIENAFHTSIHSFTANGQQFYSNTTDPQIPSALATVVSGVAHLNTIQPKPQFVQGSMGKINLQTKRLESVSSTSSNGPKANLTGGSGTSSDPYVLYIVPGDAATIYDTPNTTLNANYTSGTNYTGSGVKIGIGGEATIKTSTAKAYGSAFLPSASAPTLQYCTTSSSCSSSAGSGYYSSTSGAGEEAYIDTELSQGLAPGASIYYYASTDLTTGIEAALDANTVDIFSLSYGECEQDMSTSDNALFKSWWSQAAGQGIAVTVSSGDSGSAGCDSTSDSSGNNTTAATGGLAVNGLASTIYNIAVGGTDFYELPNAYSTYAGTSEGSSSTYYRTAKSYIPESTWNDSTPNNTTISANETWSGAGYSSSDNNIAAGSGGKSSCSTNNSTDNNDGSVTTGTCTSGYSKPSWQTGTNVPQDGVRDLPDVSLMSGDGVDDAAWLVCDDTTRLNSSYATVTTNCQTQSDGYSYFNAYGGTSTAAPAFAGMLALVQQKTGSRLGQAAKELYALYNGSYASSVFHDTTVGNISVPCTSGTTNCTKNSAGYYFESGYDTTTGYDLATGLGSVDVKQLLNYWNSVSGTAAATVSETLSASSITINQSVTASGTVVSGSSSITTTPTGTVQLSGGGYSASQDLSSGAYSFTIPANSLSAGSDTLTVTYSGDSNYASASASKSLTVNVMTPTVTVSAPSSGNVANSLSVSVTVTGPSGSTAVPSGTVSISGGGYSSGTTQLTAGSSSATATITIPANSLTAGSDTLTVTYSGDSNYATNTGSTTVTMTQTTLLTPTVNVTAASSVETGQSLNVTIAVSGSSSAESYPTGTVTLTSGSYTSAATQLSSGSATITVPANSLSVGTDTLKANYNGDTYYNTGSGTASVTVTQSVYSLTASPTSGSVSRGSSTSFTVAGSSATTGSSANYTGTVTLTCTVSTSLTSYNYLPTCSVSPTTIVFSGGTVTSTTSPTVTVSTTSATSELVYPKVPGRGWAGAGGGAVLAFLVFLGIPARRRSWRSMLGVLVLMTALGSLTGCSSVSGSTSSSGTTSGTYTVTVNGTGNDVDSTAESTTFSLTVN